MVFVERNHFVQLAVRKASTTESPKIQDLKRNGKGQALRARFLRFGGGVLFISFAYCFGESPISGYFCVFFLIVYKAQIFRDNLVAKDRKSVV